MMTFEDSNDPNYVKDILLEVEEKEAKKNKEAEKALSTSSKNPNLILKEVLDTLKQQDEMVKDFTITVQYSENDELYSYQKRFDDKSFVDVAKNYTQELVEFTEFVEKPNHAHCYEILIRNDYTCEYFKYLTNNVSNMLSFIAIRLMDIQNNKLIERTKFIQYLLDK